jgi:hypothetical protein
VLGFEDGELNSDDVLLELEKAEATLMLALVVRPLLPCVVLDMLSVLGPFDIDSDSDCDEEVVGVEQD